MYTPHHNHGLHLLHFKLNKGLKEIYASLSMRTFSLALVGIFVPVYLYTLGYPILDIILYFVLYHLFHALASIFIAGKLARRFGVKHLMLFSMPLLFLQLVFVSFLQFGYFTPLWVLALLLGLANSMYWVGFHSEFTKDSDKKHRGREASFINILASIVAALGPIIGGVIIVFLGYFALYILVLVVLVLSVIPLFRSKDFSGKKKYLISKVFSRRSLRKDYLPYVIFGVTGSIFLGLWPLIIHLKGFFSNESGLGLIFTLTFVFSIIFSIYAGRLADRLKSYVPMLKISNVIFAFIWVGRWFANSVGFLFGTEIIAGFNRPFYSIPLAKHFYNRAARSRNIIEYVVFKEATMHISASVVVFFIWLYGDIIISTFVVAGTHLLILLL